MVEPHDPHRPKQLPLPGRRQETNDGPSYRGFLSCFASFEGPELRFGSGRRQVFFDLVRQVRQSIPDAVGIIIGNSYPAAKWNLGRIGIQGGCWYRCKNAALTSPVLMASAAVSVVLLLTLLAVVFFTGVVWALARDGRLDQGDGLAHPDKGARV
jgi:hypothetical protein